MKPLRRFPVLCFWGLAGRARSIFAAPCLGQESRSKQRRLLVHPSSQSTHFLRDGTFPWQHLASLGGKASTVRVTDGRETPAACGSCEGEALPRALLVWYPTAGMGDTSVGPHPRSRWSHQHPRTTLGCQRNPVKEGLAGARGCWEAEHPASAGLVSNYHPRPRSDAAGEETGSGRGPPRAKGRSLAPEEPG